MIKKLNDIMSAEKYALKLIFESSKPLAVIYMLGYLIDYPTALLGTYLWKLIIDRIADVYSGFSGVRELWILLCIYLGINLFKDIVMKVVFGVVKPEIESRSRKILDVRVMRKMATLDEYFFDDPENRDMISVAGKSKQQISGDMTYLVRELILVITFAAGLVMFISASPIVAVVYLTTCIPSIIINTRNKTKMDRFSISSVPETRKKDYYRSILTGKAYAQEIRLFGTAEYFKERYNELWNKIRNARYEIFKKGNRLSCVSVTIHWLGWMFLIVYSVYEVLKGNYTLGTLSMLVSLSGRVGGQFTALAISVPNRINITVPHINCFRSFIEYKNKGKTDGELKIETLPDIEFRDVCFAYPNSDKNVINHLDLIIPAGRKIALVGLNGAGKTTIVKLLLRFYEPQSGNILLGGRDISEYSLKELYRMFGVCFQDVNAYSMTARENIALSDIGRLGCDDDLMNAARLSGADCIIADFASGIASDLTRKFSDGGYSLSGGQWQKIALARAFFRDSKFIILDEPSSALDPEAEDHIFSSFKKICKGRGGILISHRLSSIMMVDEVVLLKDGRVIEKGSHAELMEKGGEYADLYNMQAEKYIGAGGGI